MKVTTKRITGPAAKSVAKQDFKGDAYLHFVVGELKPFIDEHYRPLTDREHTFILGSSMGGLISLYALCEYPEVFGGAGCMSSHLSFIIPSLGLGRDAWAQAFAAYLRDNLPKANSCRVYMDHGTKSLDRTYGRYQPVVDAVFREKGWDADHYRSLVFPGHSHTETDWSARLDQPLRFLCRSGGAKRLSKIFYNFALDPYSRNHETITNDSCRPPVSGRLQEHRQSKYK